MDAMDATDATSALSLDGFKTALEWDLMSLAGSASLFGVFLHISILRVIFVEQHLYRLLGLYLATAVAILYSYITLTEFPALQSFGRTVLIFIAFNAGLVLSIGAYRLLFHPLRRFPGPLGSKLTRFYDTSLAARNIQYNLEVEKLHQKYGDFIRTGPREICVVRKSAVSLIYGPQSECLKSSWYAQVSVDHAKSSIHMTRDMDDHRRRRKAWDRGFSIKALGTYEPRIKSKVDLFASQIEDSLDKGLDATAWSMFVSFDIMGEVGFSKDFNNLKTGVEHPAIKGIHDHMAALGVLSHVPWFLNLMSRIPGATAGYSRFFKWCADEIRNKQKFWDADEYPRDLVSWLLKAFNERDVSASPSEDSLHEDSRVVIVAGSETTATTLASILYYLCKHPSTQQKLYSQLSAVFPNGVRDWTYEKAKSIFFIDDIIHETLRLKPALLTGGYRVTPSKKGLQIDEVYIPGDTNVFVPVQLIQTHPRYFPNAKEFVPERWGERREEMGTTTATTADTSSSSSSIKNSSTPTSPPYFPFSMGPYSCPGKNLAMMSLRIAVSVIMLRFSVEFGEGEDGEGFEKDVKDTFTTTLPPLKVRFKRR